MHHRRLPRIVAASLLTLASAAGLRAQVAADPAATESQNEDTIVLSPFIVSSTAETDSYLATDTLAGSRIRTDLRDVASSLTVVTSQFLRDTNAKNNQSLLQYTPNTEVGGLAGNFSAIGNTNQNGAGEGSTFVKPHQATRVRGLDSADNTRDFFISNIPWDSYNTDRVEIQRGPNSILFGVGSPAGIINAGLISAGFKNRGVVENQYSRYNSLRWSFDVNHVLLPGQLALRVAAVDDDTKYRQKPAFNHDRRLFAALRYDPLFLNNDVVKTVFRANYEHGEIDANRPRILPPMDFITPFFDAQGINKQTFDPWWAWTSGVVPESATRLPGVAKNFWVTQVVPIGGVSLNEAPVFAFDGSSATPMSARIGIPQKYFGINPAGARDGGITGFPYGSNVGIAGYNFHAWRSWEDNPSTYPAADKGFYKDETLRDSSIFDFYNHLIDGDNKREWQNWDAFNLNWSQTFLHDRVGYELVYDRQSYEDGGVTAIAPAITVDIRKNLMAYPEFGNLPVVANPNAGRAMIPGKGRYSSNETERENFRLTLFGELRASDFLSEGFLAKLLGRHRFNGLYSREVYETLLQEGVRAGVERSWSRLATNGEEVESFVRSDRQVETLSYISGPLFGTAAASGLHLPGLTAPQIPSGTYDISYFDSHWTKPTDPSAPGYVDPAAVWINTANVTEDNPDGTPSTESENPANYAGWKTGSFAVLNADRSDAERLALMLSANRTEKKLTSKAVTWQGDFWDNTLVATFGARRDRLSQRAGDSVATTTGLVDPSPALRDDIDVSEDNSVSWGLVLHTPRKWRENLPWGTHLSFTYSDGRNVRVQNRYGFAADRLPNAKGRTKDFGIVLSTLNDRLQLKTTFYKTTVTDADIASVTTQSTTLGSFSWMVWGAEVWGTGSALSDLYGFNGEAPGADWYWNWALMDETGDGSHLVDPFGPGFNNSPITIAQKKSVQSWIDQLQPQEWWDAYGIPVNVAAMKSGDYHHVTAVFDPEAGDPSQIPVAGNGRINGSWPTGTVDNESKGVEIELVGQPTPQWRISANASKQTAAQTKLGDSLVQFIVAQHDKFESPAGDLRLWWGGDTALREYYNQRVWSAYQFQLQTNGKMVPEMAPWRFNLATTYEFATGALKGFSAGLGYRWQDGVVLGYGLNEDKDNLDVDKPYWSESIDHVDLWFGYERRLTSKINWRVQVNLRNVGESPHLTPISLQPDGRVAMSRIEEGMVWTLSNTFTF